MRFIPLFFVGVLAFFAVPRAIIVIEKNTGHYPIFSQADLTARQDFHDAAVDMDQACEERQGLLAEANYLVYCDVEDGRDCARDRERNDAAFDAAENAMYGAVARRKEVGRRVQFSYGKSLLLGTLYATHSTWHCIDASLDHTYEVRVGWSPTYKDDLG